MPRRSPAAHRDIPPARRARPRWRPEIDRRILLRIALVMIVLAFLAVFVRVASLGFKASLRGVDRADRTMQERPAAAPTGEAR